MSRFFLSADAGADLTEVEEYLLALPLLPARRIGLALQGTLESIGAHPMQGAIQSELTRILGVEVRSRLVAGYRIIYRMGGSAPEIIGVMHTARDIAKIMGQRFQ